MSKFRNIVENALSNTLKEEDEDENNIDYVREQVEYWKDRIYGQENADDFYYINGKHDYDSRQLEYWEKKLEELERASRTPEENARLDAEKIEILNKRLEAYAKIKEEENRKRQEEMDKADKEWHYNEGDIVRDRKTGQEWLVEKMSRKYDDYEHTFYYDYYLKGIGDNAKDEYGLDKHKRSGNFPLNRQDLYELVSKGNNE